MNQKMVGLATSQPHHWFYLLEASLAFMLWR
jgi:hypothetical protein